MPAPVQHATFPCPSCGCTLPAQAQICQFCKADVRTTAKSVSRAAAAACAPKAQDMSWQRVAYYGMGVWWIINGLMTFLASLKFFNSMLAGAGAMFTGIPAIGMVIGVVFILVGIGLLLKIELARGIVNILSWISILGGAFRVLCFIFIGSFLGPMVFVYILRSVLDVGLAALQIYLIAETDNFM